MPHFDKNEEHTPDLVHQYEEMVRTNSIGFFEKGAFEKIIDYYEYHHDLDEALKVLEFALSQHPYSSLFYIRKAQLHVEYNKPSEAIAALDIAEIYDAMDLEIYLLRAEALSLLGKRNESLVILNQCINRFDQVEHDEIYLCMAGIYEDLESFDESFNALRSALLANPKSKPALDRMWLTVELSGLYKESVKLHEEILDLDPYSYLAWYNLGHAYISLGNHEKAVESFEFAMVINEKFEFAYRDCGEALRKLGLFERAIEVYLDAIENVRQDAEFYTSLGVCYEELNQFWKAKEFYHKAIKFDPHSDIAYFRLGCVLGKENFWLKAITVLHKALAINPQNSDYVTALADAYVETEEYQKAAEMYRDAADMAPDESAKWVQYAAFLLQLDVAEMALEILEEATVYCDGADLDYCMAACRLNLGMRRSGLDCLHSALYKDYELHTILFQIDPDLEYDADVLAGIALYLPEAD
ncbi:MAG: tetratricopeptide repeat protein [Bacteroidota bacterium]